MTNNELHSSLHDFKSSINWLTLIFKNQKLERKYNISHLELFSIITALKVGTIALIIIGIIRLFQLLITNMYDIEQIQNIKMTNWFDISFAFAAIGIEALFYTLKTLSKLKGIAALIYISLSISYNTFNVTPSYIFCI